jgi:protein involved in polysaccharide export with SLBB domain
MIQILTWGKEYISQSRVNAPVASSIHSNKVLYLPNSKPLLLIMGRIISIINNKRIVLLLSMLTLFFLSAHSQNPDGSVPSSQTIDNLLQNANINPSDINAGTVKSYLQGNSTSNTNGNNNISNGNDRNQDQNNQNNQNNNNNNNQNNQGQNLNKDSVTLNTRVRESGPEDTYGADVFGNAGVINVSELSIPPLDYPIGVGDHIIVALWGGGEDQQDYTVARDGSIFPAGLGKIIVQGLTFDQARSLIYSRFKSIVPASTNIAVTLGKPRTISVNVGGEVQNPGPYTVSAFANGFNVIGLAGGITEFGNLRAIQVKREGKVIQVLDVYKYLSTGEIGDHVYLQNNDFILVTFVEKKVQATGFFKRPMYYQLKKDEGLKALIQYSGGFRSTAYTSALKIIRNENEKQLIHNVNATALLKDSNYDYALQDADIIEADSIKLGITNKVEIKGAITYPGIYEVKEGDRLFDLLDRAGGILKNTYMHRIYIFRGGADTTATRSDRIELDISNLDSANNAKDTNNILLQTNDLIQLFTKNEFIDPEYVDIFGEVRKEGHIKRFGGMTLQDLLYLSGGIKPSAQYGRLEISSIVDVDSAERGLGPTRTIVRSYAILPNLELDTVASEIIIHNYDQIFVRANPDFRTEQNVQLQGLFKYPGYYPRLFATEKLSDYVKRAGGFKDNADLSGAILYRQNVDLYRQSIVHKTRTDQVGNVVVDSTVQNLNDPVSIDLGKALQSNNDREDIILQENDIIYVPEINPFVTVTGSVQSPLKVTFDDRHTRLGYYIDQAGGYGIDPWRKRIFVTYANGKSKRTNNFAFFHFYPRVVQGCTIMVPQRPTPTNGVGNVIGQSVTAMIPVIVGYLILKTL